MMTEVDAALETALALATLRLQTATTPKRRREAFKEMQRLHKLKTPEHIERQERERGLRR